MAKSLKPLKTANYSKSLSGSAKVGKNRKIVDILGTKVDDISFDDAVSSIIELAKRGDRGHYVVTVNPEFVMMARQNPDFAKILEGADLALPDGAGVVISKLIFGGKVQERVTGVDLVDRLCQKAHDLGLTVGFLGGFGGVADKVAKRQKIRHPGLKVVLARPGDPAIGQDLRLKSAISALGRIDILFVAYGMGQQEFWIARHRKNGNIGVFIGVGGAFDYLSFAKKRAPIFLQKAGFEWFWRLFSEPKRAWRMRVLPIFFILVGAKSFLRKINL